MKLRFLLEAEAEILAAVGFYKERDLGLAVDRCVEII